MVIEAMKEAKRDRRFQIDQGITQIVFHPVKNKNAVYKIRAYCKVAGFINCISVSACRKQSVQSPSSV